MISFKYILIFNPPSPLSNPPPHPAHHFQGRIQGGQSKGHNQKSCKGGRWHECFWVIQISSSLSSVPSFIFFSQGGGEVPIMPIPPPLKNLRLELRKGPCIYVVIFRLILRNNIRCLLYIYS